MGQLVVGVSHEINTPLGIGVTSITYMSKYIKEFEEKYHKGNIKTKDLDEMLETLNEATEIIFLNMQKAAHLVESFKQVSVDQTSMEKRKFSLSKVFRTQLQV